MTQPRDPADPPPPDEQPTVAWTPAEPSGPETPARPDPVAPPTEPSAASPASPIISAAQLAGAAGTSGAPFAASEPGATGTAPTGAAPTDAAPTGDQPVVPWAPPGPAAVVANRDGYVLSGVVARLVAYLIDGVLVSIIPTIIGAIVADPNASLGGLQVGQGGAVGQLTQPVTVQRVLLEFIGLGINFLYFVGLWTSSWRATIGQRLLSIQVADAATGQGLGIGAAFRRWLAFGAPLSLLTLIPGLASLSSLLSLGLVLLLLVTTVTDQRRQGLQDRFAGSLVIRRATSGDGAVFFGCLILIALVIVIGLVFSAFAIASLGPDYWDRLFEQIGNSI